MESILDVAGNGTSAGKEGCRCVDNAALLASATGRECTTSDGRDGVLLDVAGPCVDATYGSSRCIPHELGVYPECTVANNNASSPSDLVVSNETTTTSMPEYCFRSWCYVDAAECMATEERLFRSHFFPAGSGVDLFWSYSTCGPTPEDWFESAHFALGGVSVTGIAAAYNIVPWVYKRDYEGNVPVAPGEEYYDNDVSYEGVHVDFVQALQDVSDGDFEVEYVHGSKASRVVHPASPGTAAVQDVADGLVDIVIGPIWITGGRLKMTTFTMPIHHDRTVLVIPNPGSSNSLNAQTQKVLDPFTWGVWGLLLAIITATALLSTWFRFTEKEGKMKRLRKRIITRFILDEFLQKGMFFCSAGIEQDEGASLPHKLLMFGFGFFILIIVSAYVANLAAFLTRSTLSGDAVRKIEDAVAAEMKICAHPALQSDLELAHPEAKFVFNQEGKELYGLVDDFDNNLCDVMAVGKMDSLGDMKLMDLFCERELVYTDSLIIENPVGFPIRKDLASGFSYWIYQAEKYHGVTVQASEKAYNEENNMKHKCNVMLSDQGGEEDEYAQIRVENLIFPVMFFFGFAVFAVLLEVYHLRATRKAKPDETGKSRRSTLVGRASTLNLFNSINEGDQRKQKKYDDNDDEEEVYEDKTHPYVDRCNHDRTHRSSVSIAKGTVTPHTVIVDESSGSSTEHSSRNLESFDIRGRWSSGRDGLDNKNVANRGRNSEMYECDAVLLEKLDDIMDCYQSMKRRKKTTSNRFAHY